MFGLTEEQYLAGPDPNADSVKFTVSGGGYGWSNGTVPADMPAIDYTTGNEVTLKRGTIVRVYVGTIPTLGPQKGVSLTTPNKDGLYIVEPAGGGYWLAYVDSPDTEALMASPAYQAALPKLQSRLLAAKLSPKDLIPLGTDGTADNAANAQGLYDSSEYETDPNGFPVLDPNGKPKKKAAGGGDHNPPEKKQAGGGIGLLLGAALILLLLNSKKS